MPVPIAARPDLFVLIGALLFSAAARAEEPREAASEADAAQAFEPSFFEAFAPRTALDMVERVPGFRIDEGEERRGFAGAQTNVLIDGEPPASKAREIEDILAAIPASDVERIELVRSSAAGSSQSVRVNVVRRAGGGEGLWTLELARAEDGRVSPSGEAAFSGRRGEVRYGLSAALEIEHLPIGGERADFDAAGALTERHAETLPTDEREARIAGEASLPAWGGEAAFNAQLSRIELDERFAAQMTDAGGASVGAEAGDLTERETTGELGVVFRRPLGDWQAEAAAIITRRRFEGQESTLETDGAGALEEATQQNQRLESGETIMRALGRREWRGGWRLELGGEAAFNTLEQRLSLTEDDGGGPVPVPLPSANVRVEELRGEASVMLFGPLAPRWTLEAGAAAERSRLTQSGDVEAQTELTYFKPSLQLARALGERSQLRLRLYRDVSQLDFEDFVTAADIQNAVVNAGNPNLRPQTSWRVEAAADWRFGDDAALNITLYRWAIEDALDIVPVGPPGDRFDAPGNIGDAALWGARVQFAWPLPWDAELNIDAMSQRSEATDPLTGETRELSEIDESIVSVELRQDLGAYAWGVDYERESETPLFRLDRVEAEQDAEDLTLWIETTAYAGLKLRAWMSNVTDDAETRRRTLFDPDRLGAFDGSDVRARNEGVMFGLSASGRF